MNTENKVTVLIGFSLGTDKIELIATHISSVPPHKNFFNINIPHFSFRVVHNQKVV
jgi:hypothetical protein